MRDWQSQSHVRRYCKYPIVGSWIANVRFQVTDAHALNHMGRDPFRIQHGFIGGHLEMSIVLVDSTKDSSIGAERRTRPFTGMTVDLAAAITIAIARPCMHAVADRRLKRMTAIVALPRIGASARARNRDVCRDPVVTGVFGRVVTDPRVCL
jgi:hypothetical protein